MKVFLLQLVLKHACFLTGSTTKASIKFSNSNTLIEHTVFTEHSNRTVISIVGIAFKLDYRRIIMYVIIVENKFSMQHIAFVTNINFELQSVAISSRKQQI